MAPDIILRNFVQNIVFSHILWISCRKILIPLHLMGAGFGLDFQGSILIGDEIIPSPTLNNAAYI